jgi:hypothetical protein
MIDVSFPAPKTIIYDNACILHNYVLARDPCFFRETEFYVDRLHWQNHTGQLFNIALHDGV